MPLKPQTYIINHPRGNTCYITGTMVHYTIAMQNQHNQQGISTKHARIHTCTSALLEDPRAAQGAPILVISKALHTTQNMKGVLKLQIQINIHQSQMYRRKIKGSLLIHKSIKIYNLAT